MLWVSFANVIRHFAGKDLFVLFFKKQLDLKFNYNSQFEVLTLNNSITLFLFNNSRPNVSLIFLSMRHLRVILQFYEITWATKITHKQQYKF